ncbi:MAG TPA: ATP synthase F0 subunit B, partial [Gemmatimonadales bacterium]
MLNLMLAAPETAGAPVSPFEVNFGLFVWTWLVFITLFFLLKKYAWPALLKATEDRERAIQAQLDEAERLNAEARAHAAEQAKALAETRASV